MSGKITIDDVARELGVSKTTVSRAISGKGRISEETREKVLSYITVHNYKPNVIAQGLAQRKTYNIAVVWPADADTVELPFFQRFLVGMSERAAESGYDVLVTLDHPDDMSGLKRIIEKRKVDGVIITRTLVNDPSAAYIKSQDIPFVTIGTSPDESVTMVDNDNVGGCRELTSILLGKGYRKLALIGGSKNHAITIQRLQGFTEALNAAGLKLDNSYVYLDVESDLRVKSIIHEALINHVDCAICMDDNLTEKFLMLSHAEGIRIPEDIRLASFYDSTILENAQPSITSLKFDEKLLGSTAASILFEKIEGRPAENKILTKYEVVLKESTQ